MSSLGNIKGFGLFLKIARFIIFVLLLFATEFYKFLTHFGYLSFIIYEVHNAKSFIRYFKNYIYLLVSYVKIPVKEPFLVLLVGSCVFSSPFHPFVSFYFVSLQV